MPKPGPDLAPALSARPPGGFLNRARLALAADWLAVAIAASLPISTSATGILIGIWLIVVIPTFDMASVRREVISAAGGLPVLLWAFAVLGMLWADVSWTARLEGLSAFHKLLLIPLLLAHFRRSGRAHWVALGLLATAAVVLVISWALALLPDLTWRGRFHVGVPFKDQILQSAIFALCAFGFLGWAGEIWRAQRLHALMATGVAVLFLANILYVATARTTLVAIAVLSVLLGVRRLGWKGAVAAVLVGGVLAGAAWTSSAYLRQRVETLIEQIRSHSDTSSPGLRIGFWKQSADLIADAPILGHGTGTIETLFRRLGETDPNVAVTANPYNQILAVGIQLGLTGVALLIAMWIAHLALFAGPGLLAWIGLMVVVQNIVGSLFNSHIGDFSHGWLYVLGAGVMGGALLHRPPAMQGAAPAA
jgi:O-antigen ligase